MEKIDIAKSRKVIKDKRQSLDSNLRALQAEASEYDRILADIDSVKGWLDEALQLKNNEGRLQKSITELQAQETQLKTGNAELDKEAAAHRGVINKLKEQADAEQEIIDRLEARKAELETEVGRLAGRVEVQRAERRVS